MSPHGPFLCSVLLHGMTLLLIMAMTFSSSETSSPQNIEILTLLNSPDATPTAHSPALAPKIPRQKQLPPAAQTLAQTAPAVGADSPNDPLSIGETGQTAEDDLSEVFLGRRPSSPREHYLALVRDAILKKQEYPRPSRAFREEGLVLIRLTLAADGSLQRLELIQGSPHSRLNDAAMKAATKAAPFASFPQELSYSSWKITLPVRFTLAQNQR